METLLIAPESDIKEIAEEARHIQEAINAQVLNGRVTPKTVADAIANRMARKRTLDMIFFIGHGSIAGLHLTDGYIAIADLCRYMKTAGAKYLILNTCDSEFIALAIHHETGATVVCTVGPIDTLQAYATSRFMAEAIANGATVEQAYEQARPSGAGPSTYRIIPEQVAVTAMPQEQSAHEVLQEIREAHRQQQEQINQLTALMMAQQKRHGPEIQESNAQIRTHREERVRLPSNYRAVYAAAFAALFMPVATFFVDFRNALDINAAMAYALSFLFYLISFTLFAYLWGFIGNGNGNGTR